MRYSQRTSLYLVLVRLQTLKKLHHIALGFKKMAGSQTDEFIRLPLGLQGPPTPETDHGAARAGAGRSGQAEEDGVAEQPRVSQRRGREGAALLPGTAGTHPGPEQS